MSTTTALPAKNRYSTHVLCAVCTKRWGASGDATADVAQAAAKMARDDGALFVRLPHSLASWQRDEADTVVCADCVAVIVRDASATPELPVPTEDK